MKTLFPINADGTRICSKCLKLQRYTDFIRNRSGYRSQCRACVNSYQREFARRNKATRADKSHNYKFDRGMIQPRQIKRSHYDIIRRCIDQMRNEIELSDHEFCNAVRHVAFTLGRNRKITIQEDKE